MCKPDVIKLIEDKKIITVIRNIPSDELLGCVNALYEGGIRLVEVAFDPSNRADDDSTADAIKLICDEFPGLCVGAGTVLTAAHVRLAAECGAKYIVSPNTNAYVIKTTAEYGMVSIPGALTPSEICSAKALGADFVKVFPAGCMGVECFAALSSPLGSIPLLAVGGIELEDIPKYLKHSVKGFGISTKILKPELVKAKDYAAITALARAYVSAAKG